MMPIDLVLVRHGESEQNAAKVRERAGEDFPEDLFKGRHSSSFRLSDKGIAQAKKAGEWLQENFSQPFSRYYTSAYLRAMETAGYLALPGANWYVEPALRERDWGDLDVLSEKDRHEKFVASWQMKQKSPMFWIPPNGESIAQVAETRTKGMLGTLARDCADKRVIIVCHGETMWSFRLPLERMSEERYNELDMSKDPKDRIHNCQILHYTRCKPGLLAPEKHFTHMRSICPWDTKLSSNEWLPIQHPAYSNERLLEIVSKTERRVND